MTDTVKNVAPGIDIIKDLEQCDFYFQAFPLDMKERYTRMCTQGFKTEQNAMHAYRNNQLIWE